MLSIQECRKHLGKDAESMTDDEVSELLIAINRFCTKFLDDYFAEEFAPDDIQAILSSFMEHFIRRQAIQRTLAIMQHDEEAPFPTEREWMYTVLIRYSMLLPREEKVFVGLIKELHHCIRYGQEVPFIPDAGSLFSITATAEDIPDDFKPSEKELQRMRLKMIDELVSLKIARTENSTVIALLDDEKINKLENYFMILGMMEEKVYKEFTEGKERPERYIDYDSLTGILNEVINGKAHSMRTLQLSSQTKRFMDFVWENQKQKLSKRTIAIKLGIDPKDLKHSTYIGDMGFNDEDRRGCYFLAMGQGFVWFQKEYEHSVAAEKQPKNGRDAETVTRKLKKVPPTAKVCVP